MIITSALLLTDIVFNVQVVLAFSECHAQKVAYRDLKPENLVLDAKGYCVMVDFGLAKRCDDGQVMNCILS